MEEYSATPAKYLKHPDMHPERLTQFPGSKKIPNYREELFQKAGYKEHDPSHPQSHGHH